MMKKNLIIGLILLISININSQYTVGVSYYGDSSWIEYIPGDMPIIIVAPHAGTLQPNSLPDINTRGSDNGTMDLALFMKDSLHFKSGGCRPHIIINHLRPNKLNPVKSASDSVSASGTNTYALNALNEFHNFIQIAHAKVTADFGKGHYFELHGNGTAEKWNMIGLGIPKSVLKLSDSVINTKVNNSTIKNLCTSGGANFLEVLKGTTSLGGMLDSLGWKSSPSPAHPSPPDSVTFFYAGQNTWRYGSKYTGSIDATHLETYWQFMVYNSNKSKYSNDLADVMLKFMTIHYGFTFNCSPLSINESERKQVQVYPNPATQKINIETQVIFSNIKLYSIDGKEVLSRSLRKGINSINISKLNRGIYFYVISDATGTSNSNKIIIE